MYTYKSGIEQIDQLSGGFEAGTNILILAPSMSFAEQLAYSLTKPLEGEYAITLSTNERAAEVVDFFKLAGSDKRFIGVIDAITKSSTPSIVDTPRLMFVSSPTDLTGIGIKFSNMIETIFEGEFSDGEAGLFPPPIRFCVNSISTLLMYRKLEVLYQFLHVLTAKLKKIEGVGIYLLNSESFDDKTRSLIKQLMNCVIEVKIEQNVSYLRIQGIRGVNSDWQKFSVNKGQVTILA
ncbi:MAG: RAD55 family ATPase [Methanoregula sp.]